MDAEQPVRRLSLIDAIRIQQRQSEEMADRAQWIGYATSSIGFLVAFTAAFVCLAEVVHVELLAGLLFLFAVAALPVGLGAGRLAHVLFYRTCIPVSWMAIALALTADMTILGWLLVHSWSD